MRAARSLTASPPSRRPQAQPGTAHVPRSTFPASLPAWAVPVLGVQRHGPRDVAGRKGAASDMLPALAVVLDGIARPAHCLATAACWCWARPARGAWLTGAGRQAAAAVRCICSSVSSALLLRPSVPSPSALARRARPPPPTATPAAPLPPPPRTARQPPRASPGSRLLAPPIGPSAADLARAAAAASSSSSLTHRPPPARPCRRAHCRLPPSFGCSPHPPWRRRNLHLARNRRPPLTAATTRERAHCRGGCLCPPRARTCPTLLPARPRRRPSRRPWPSAPPRPPPPPPTAGGRAPDRTTATAARRTREECPRASRGRSERRRGE